MRGSILIVDDNPEQRDVLCRYLEFAGGRTREAGSGAEALRAATASPPDLVLLDLVMPGMDGWETLRGLKSDPTTAWVPVIALTVERVDWPRLQQAGFCGYLAKPIAPFRVLVEVERCVGRLFEPRYRPSPPEAHEWSLRPLGERSPLAADHARAPSRPAPVA
jgi:CheY-like chemotaxis protein